MTDDPPRPSVLVDNRQSIAVDVEELVRLARTTLESEGITDGELSVALVSRNEIAELHERYLGEPGPTDVLSFPQDGPREEGEPALLGDVVICPEVAAELNRDAAAELRLLLVHGILHLLGYDHQTDEDRSAMWSRQERYVSAFATETEKAGR